MSQTASILNRAEAVRNRTLSALRALTERARAIELPEPSEGLAQCGKKLEENIYQVLVVGEAKRGKSTFVNALIGRDLLPTDVDVATSQVFRVCAAEQEAYRLRFEDGSQMAITAADLPRYGSQVLADVEGVPRLDQIIRWIEVDVPVRFLPANVRVLDTPGLGALYAAHAQITYRFVPHADAVIFVLDSQAPTSEPEITLVEKILEVTPHILFIQSKIDQFRKEAWQAVQQRNEEILRQRLANRLPDVRVWPISSTNLRKAGQTGDEDYLLVSRHKELAVALQAFLFRVAGWGRSAEAVLLAAHYHGQSRSILNERLKNLADQSREEAAEAQRLATERRRQFEAEWGERGQKRRDLLDSIQKEINLGRLRIRHALQQGGDLENQFRFQIETLTEIAQAERLAKTLPEEVRSAAMAVCREVQQATTAKCMQALGSFASAVEGINISGMEQAIRSRLETGTGPDFQVPGAERWMKTLRNATFGSAVVHLLIPALAAPVWLVPAIAFLAVGIPSALIERRQQLRTAKLELLRHLVDALQRLRNRLLFEVDQSAGRFSAVDECFGSLERALTAQIGRVASQNLTDIQAEINRMTEEAKLSDVQRKIKAEQLCKHLAEWDGLGQETKAIQSELRELDRLLATQSSV